MNQLQTRGIVLKRTDYGEADRILTVLTPDYGKLRLMARGVRRPKSKLAGGIELFSVSDMSFIRGRGEIGTLVSTRLDKHYGRIVGNIDRVQLGYDLIKMLDRVTEDEPESEYFGLLEQTLADLENDTVSADLIRTWFGAQLLQLAGHGPNLETTPAGKKLTEDQNYSFDYENMAFEPQGRGKFNTDDIKFLRLIFSGNGPQALNRIKGSNDFIKNIAPMVQAMLQTHLRV